MDSVSLRVEEILGDAFAEAYGLVDRDEHEFEPDPEIEEDEDE
jgi:hypothetical protein